MPQPREQRALSALRVVVAGLLFVHGVARVSLGIVDDFGVFLTAVGIPLGAAVAWGATLFELVGGAVLASGRWVRPIAAVFTVELLAGIALVHGPEGWFVVGAGRNGMEYSVLLIVALAALAYADRSNAAVAATVVEGEVGGLDGGEA
ncbi:MAG: DoxX family protein [Gemmatimonadota bacterium]